MSTSTSAGDDSAAEHPTADLSNEDLLHLTTDDRDLDRVDRSIVFGSWLSQLALWALRLFLIAVAGYAIWFLLEQFWAGLLPMILALIICTVLAPPTTWMRRKGVPNALAAILSVLTAFGVVGGILAIVAPNIINQSRVLYLQALEGIQRLQLWVQGPPLNLNAEDVDRVVNDIAGWIQEQSGRIAGTVFSGISSITGTIITLFMVLILVIFFLKDGHLFLPWLRKIMGRRGGWHATELLTRSWTTLGGYIRAQAIVSLVDAVFIGLGLWLLDVPMAFTLGVITFVAGFIPYVGAITAGALAVLVALVTQGFTTALLALGVVLLVQQLEGNILSPLLQSRAMNLHPVIVLVSVVIGGGLFGIIGAFLAVPAAAMIAVVLRYFNDIAALQSGEKMAADIEFITPEGKATGKITEIKGSKLREQWREDGVFALSQTDVNDALPESREDAEGAEEAVEAAEAALESTESTGSSARPANATAIKERLRRSREAIERAIGGKRSQ